MIEFKILYREERGVCNAYLLNKRITRSHQQEPLSAAIFRVISDELLSLGLNIPDSARWKMAEELEQTSSTNLKLG